MFITSAISLYERSWTQRNTRISRRRSGQQRDLAIEHRSKLFRLDAVADRRCCQRELGEGRGAAFVGALTAMLAHRVVARDSAEQCAQRTRRSPVPAPIPQLAKCALRDVFGGVLRGGDPRDVVDDEHPVFAECHLECVGVIGTQTLEELLVGPLSRRLQRRPRCCRGVRSPKRGAHGGTPRVARRGKDRRAEYDRASIRSAMM